MKFLKSLILYIYSAFFILETWLWVNNSLWGSFILFLGAVALFPKVSLKIGLTDTKRKILVSVAIWSVAAIVNDSTTSSHESKSVEPISNNTSSIMILSSSATENENAETVVNIEKRKSIKCSVVNVNNIKAQFEKAYGSYMVRLGEGSPWLFDNKDEYSLIISYTKDSLVSIFAVSDDNKKSTRFNNMFFTTINKILPMLGLETVPKPIHIREPITIEKENECWNFNAIFFFSTEKLSSERWGFTIDIRTMKSILEEGKK